MTREGLIKTVALKMDEISSSDEVLVKVTASDNNPLYTQIDGLLNESVNEVLMKAPIYRLSSQIDKYALCTTEDIFGGARKKAVFTLPGDFIRVVSISDPIFQRPIVDLAIQGDETDKMQHNKHLVAKTAKPVAVIEMNDTGNRIISCYSYGANDKVTPTMLYVKRYSNVNPMVDTGLDEYLTDIVAWVCAGKVFGAQGDINKNKICNDNAIALMV